MLIRWLLRLGVILLVVAASGLVLNQAHNYFSTKFVSGVPEPRYRHTRKGGDFSGELCEGHHSRAIVEVSLLGLNVIAGTAEVGIGLCVPAAVLHHLRAYGPPERTIFRDVGEHMVLKQRFRRLKLRIEVNRALFHVEIPFTRLTAAEEPYEFGEADMEFSWPRMVPEPFPAHLFVARVQLPVTGYPEDFPLDTYEVSIQTKLGLPEGIFDADETEDPFFPETIPVSSELSVTPVLRGFAFSEKPDEMDGFSFAIARRSAQTIVFSFLMALVPLAFVCTLTIFISDGKLGNVANLFLGSAGILFAILPIRTIIVPDGLPTPTLVDYLLGWEVSILALVTVWLGTSRHGS